MNKLEYIPGDLVMVKKSALQFAKDKIFKVISSLSGGFLKVVMLNDSSTTYSISNNAIRPIPLTPEILEKNGWKRNGGQYSFTYKPCAGGKVELIGFFIEMFKDVHDMLKHRYFQITHKNKVICGCFYVHELQHLLFGLGINHEMEV
jgi:hypothetical protein|nr:MAG TPA: hypothetical protein [Caudoviricetes sp.]